MTGRSCLNIEPVAENRVVLSTGKLKIVFSVTDDKRSVSILISDNAKWEINKTFKKLGSRNHIDIKIKGWLDVDDYMVRFDFFNCWSYKGINVYSNIKSR